MSWLITWLTLTPLLGAAIILGLEPHKKSLARGLGLAFSLGSLALAMVLMVYRNRRSISLDELSEMKG